MIETKVHDHVVVVTSKRSGKHGWDKGTYKKYTNTKGEYIKHKGKNVYLSDLEQLADEKFEIKKTNENGVYDVVGYRTWKKYRLD